MVTNVSEEITALSVGVKFLEVLIYWDLTGYVGKQYFNKPTGFEVKMIALASTKMILKNHKVS